MFWTFVAPTQVASGVVTIDGPEGHHLARVRRLRPGERGVVVVGAREFEVEVSEVGAARVVARVVSERPISNEPTIDVVLFQALLPNPDFDAVIENGTALGIGRLVAIQAARSVARPAAGRSERWRAIATSAAEQSHRGRVPRVEGPMSLGAALEREASAARLLILDPMARRSLASAIDESRSYHLAVGPEGGWTEDELRLMTTRGGVSVSLGPRILRARLAPVIATAILVQQR